MEDRFEKAARRELVDGPRLGFRIHLGVYVAVQVLLVATWALTSYDDGTFGFPWFVFPLAGWGIGLVAHYVAMRGTTQRHEGA